MSNVDHGTSPRREICRSCGDALDPAMLDLGALPPCNRYTSDAPVRETRHLQVAQCQACGLVQLADDTPVAFVRPRVPWIRYNEPDGHLADVGHRLDAPAAAAAAGVGPFDPPLLDLLAARGLRTRMFDPRPIGDDGDTGFPYLETLQRCLRPGPLARLARAAGTADIVICRYLLEHSHDPVASLRGLRCLVNPDGAVVVEVPDSAKFMQRRDYSFVWEEHICYFDEGSLTAMATRAGFLVDRLLRYEGVLEDALVAILRPRSEHQPDARPSQMQGRQTALPFHDFRSAFPEIRAAYQTRMRALTADDRRVALVGLGHQAVMFVNAMGLQQSITLMVDDDRNKAGCFVPGTATRIVPTAALLEDQALSACIVAVSPRAAPVVLERLRPLRERGVRLYALSPGSLHPTMLDDAACT